MAASPHTRLTRTCRHPVYRGTIALQRWRFGFCTRTTANEPSAFGGKLTLPGLPQPCGFALGLGVRSTECLDEHKNRPRVDHECARWSPSAAQASTLRRDPQVLNVSGSFACSFLGIAASVDRQCFDEGRPAMNTALAARARRSLPTSAAVLRRAKTRVPSCRLASRIDGGWTANATGSRNRDLPAFARPL